MPADLRPFGFTATENLAYGALLELGPSSAYALARRLSIARANAYQALDGLVSKRAASLVSASPKRYRAIQPQALLAHFIEAQAQKLDRLERQIGAEAGEGERPLIVLAGNRSVREAATRAILRAVGPVWCLGGPIEIEALAPAIRARGASGRDTSVWVVGNAGPLPIPISGTADAEMVARQVAAVPLLLTADGALAAAASPEGGLAGYWSSDPLFTGLVRTAIGTLTKS